MAVTDAGQNSQVGQDAANTTAQQTSKAPNVADIFNRLSSQGGWSGDALNYLEVIRKKMEDPSQAVRAEMRYISDEAVAFTNDTKSIILVREPDIVNIQAMANDARLLAAREAFYNIFPSNKLINIVSVNRFMYNRTSQMSEYLSQTLISQSDPFIEAMTIDDFGGSTAIDIDTEISNVRQFFDQHSPHSTISGQFGFVAYLNTKADSNRQAYDYNKPPMFGATGYVEFMRNEVTGIHTPVVHVTDILSMVSDAKMLALALPLIADVFMNRHLWRKQFDPNSATTVNIGNLIIDPATGQPIEVKTDEDFRRMFRVHIGPPQLAIDIGSGRATIPGIGKITRPGADHQILIKSVCDFLKINPVENLSIGNNIFGEIVGISESAKTDKFSNLMDTRDMTYLWACSNLKYSPQLEYLLGRIDTDPVRRFDNLRNFFGQQTITPTHSSITTLFNRNFIMMAAQASASKIRVNIPLAAEMPMLDMTTYSDTAYVPGAAMFGQAGPTSLIGGSWY